MGELLPCVEIEPGRPALWSVIWLHGLGADGHDFEPIVPYLGLEDRAVRFVFPHAPRRPVTINMGLIMRAWYDIRGLDVGSDPDVKAINESRTMVTDLVDRERDRGMASGRVVLAGFSQGGVIAQHVALRYPERLAGLVALSTYLPDVASLEREASPANRDLPIFQAHGLDDPVIPLALAEEGRKSLEGLGHAVTWKTYPMQHAVHPDEIADLSAWLRDLTGG